MAILINYDFDGNVYPNAYLKIQKISSANADIETYFEQEDGSSILSWVKNPEHYASIFVYGDAEARRNNARPIHHFGIEFDYDIDSDKNIYKVAYEALKNVERIQAEIFEDV